MGPVIVPIVPIVAVGLLVAAVAWALVSIKRRDDRQARRVRTKSGRFVTQDPTPAPNSRVGRGPNRRMDL